MTTMPTNRLLRAYLTEAKYELLRVCRMPAFVIPFLVLPVVLYLFFGVYLAGASPQPPPPRYPFTGFSVFGIMGPGLFGFGIGIATERDQGLLALRRALPMSVTAHLLAKMAMAVVFSAMVILTMIVAAVTVGPLRLTAVQMIATFAIGMLGTLPFCAMGLFLGTRVSGRAAPGLVNVLYLPMIYLSSILIPLPGKMAAISIASPAFHLNQLALGAIGGTPVFAPAMHVAVLAGVTVLFTGLSVKRLVQVG